MCNNFRTRKEHKTAMIESKSHIQQYRYIQEAVIMNSNNHVEHLHNKHASETRASSNIGEYYLASCLHTSFNWKGKWFHLVLKKPDATRILLVCTNDSKKVSLQNAATKTESCSCSCILGNDRRAQICESAAHCYNLGPVLCTHLLACT